jgi:hypothetical protein
MRPDKTLAVFLTYLGKKGNSDGHLENETAAYAQFRQLTAICKTLAHRNLSRRDWRTRCGLHRQLTDAFGWPGKLLSNRAPQYEA